MSCRSASELAEMEHENHEKFQDDCGTCHWERKYPHRSAEEIDGILLECTCGWKNPHLQALKAESVEHKKIPADAPREQR